MFTLLEEILMHDLTEEEVRSVLSDYIRFEVIAAAQLAHVDVFAEKLPKGWNTKIGENGTFIQESLSRLVKDKTVINNVPVLMAVLVLTIPVAILAMRLAERALKNPKEVLK